MTGFTLPTSRPITQAWAAEFDDWNGDGIVDYPGGFYHSIGWDGHNGIDYGCFVGDSVEAVADGVVVFAGDAGNWHAILSGGGNAILVEHPEYGVQTEYLHLSEWLVQAGQTVKRGQVIGRSGQTGAATAPHLHLGMLKLHGYNLADRWRGRINPTPYLYGNLNPDYAGGAAMGPQGTVTPTKEWYLMPDIPKDNLLQIAAAVNNREFRDAIATEAAAKVLAAPILSTDKKKWPLSAHIQGNTARTVEALGRVAALTELVGQVAKAQGTKIDYAKVEAAAAAGAQKALAEAHDIDVAAIADAVNDEAANRLGGK